VPDFPADAAKRLFSNYSFPEIHSLQYVPWHSLYYLFMCHDTYFSMVSRVSNESQLNRNALNLLFFFKKASNPVSDPTMARFLFLFLSGAYCTSFGKRVRTGLEKKCLIPGKSQ